MNDRVDFSTILPDNVSDRYRIKKRIGKGGMGHVYLAEDIELSRMVAIKTIRPELVQNEDVRKRIEHECKMHAAVRTHPHIIGLYDRIATDNNIFLIMEYVEGITLTELIYSAKSKREEISASLTVNIIIQILDALHCIHQYEIIHRDIKPSNILVGGLDTPTPYAKLMDFGIAREILDNDNLTKLTMVDSGGPGTPAYMAPERIDSKTYGEICPATDLYSVGIILYELLFLDPPFSGTMTEVFSGHLAREPDLEKLTDISEALRKVLNKALIKKAHLRYQDAQRFSIELKAAGVTVSEETLLSTSFDPSTLNETILNTTYNPTALPVAKMQVQGKYLALATGLFLVSIVSFGLYLYSSKEVIKPELERTIIPSESAIPASTKVPDQVIPEPEMISQKEGDNQAPLPEKAKAPPKTVQLYGTSGQYPLVDEENAAINAFESLRKEREQSTTLQRLEEERKQQNSPTTTVSRRLTPKQRTKTSDNLLIIPKI